MIENKNVLLCEAGSKSVNRLKNRYKDVLPCEFGNDFDWFKNKSNEIFSDDKYRVILESDKNSDYINASIVQVSIVWKVLKKENFAFRKDLWGNRRYIAAQGPNDDSLTDFLCMIWEQQVTSIVCTANETEAGRVRMFWKQNLSSSIFAICRVNFVVIGLKMKSSCSSVPIVSPRCDFTFSVFFVANHCMHRMRQIPKHFLLATMSCVRWLSLSEKINDMYSCIIICIGMTMMYPMMEHQS